ncbi:MAG TPA: HD domain-containing phosphohydrolase [Streptosporangiaceae bacterium]|nr:HD domain-containing phosphohydrolase [Streptosporangiaceae bacterium]
MDVSQSQSRIMTPGVRGRSRRPAPSGARLLAVAAGLLVAVALVQTVLTGVTAVRWAIAFAALIALGELLRLNLPGDREAAPIGTACALAYALLIRVGPVPAQHSALQVVAVAGAGMILGALPHVAVGRPARLASMAARLIAVAGAAFAFRPLAGSPVVVRHWWTAFAVMAALLAAAWLVDVLIEAMIRASALRTPLWVTFTDELRVQGPLGVAVGASAALIVFAAEAMGLAAVAVFIAPLLVTQVAFRRYAGIRATYLQTVRALARVTEIGGYVAAGHADRVSRLAVAVGRELGLSEQALLELQYAALIHDIGQLSLPDPIPGGGTVQVSPEDQRRIAELGAEVIEQAKMLDSVAEIVRRQSDPYPGRPGPGSPPLSSRIIRAANAFDDLVGSSANPARAAAVVDKLRLGAGAGYDPAVVEALARIIARRTPPARS